LATVKHDGQTVDVVALASKNGFLYVFDRVFALLDKPALS
jgi:quinoprotein glucose dehydrogenase